MATTIKDERLDNIVKEIDNVKSILLQNARKSTIMKNGAIKNIQKHETDVIEQFERLKSEVTELMMKDKTEYQNQLNMLAELEKRVSALKADARIRNTTNFENMTKEVLAIKKKPAILHKYKYETKQSRIRSVRGVNNFAAAAMYHTSSTMSWVAAGGWTQWLLMFVIVILSDYYNLSLHLVLFIIGMVFVWRRLTSERECFKVQKVWPDQEEDLDCAVTGLCYISGYLAIVDNKSNSLILQDLDNNFNVADVQINNQPWDVTALAEDKLVVTCPNQNHPRGRIYFITIDDLKQSTSLLITKNISLRYNCFGIDYLQHEDRLVVSYSSGRSRNSGVAIVDLNGRVFKNIKLDLSNPFYVQLSPVENVLYVSAQNTLTKISLEGKELDMFSGTDDAFGIAVDSFKSVHFCANRLLFSFKSGLKIKPGLKIQPSITIPDNNPMRSVCVGKYLKREVVIFSVRNSNILYIQALPIREFLHFYRPLTEKEREKWLKNQSTTM